MRAFTTLNHSFHKVFVMSSNSIDIPSALDNPLAFLQAAASSAPSNQFLPFLAGDIVSILKQSPDLCVPYLFAVAKHLPTENLATSSTTVVASPAENSTSASRENENSLCIRSTILNVRSVPHFFFNFFVKESFLSLFFF